MAETFTFSGFTINCLPNVSTSKCVPASKTDPAFFKRRKWIPIQKITDQWPFQGEFHWIKGWGVNGEKSMHFWDMEPRNGCWVVVSNIFCFHPYLGKWFNLTNIFQMGWNHQLVDGWLEDDPFLLGPRRLFSGAKISLISGKVDGVFSTFSAQEVAICQGLW